MPLPLVLPLPPPVEPPVLELRQDVAEASPPAPVDTAAFMPGHVEVKLRVGFSGYGYGPLSLLSSFIGWHELQGAVDLGLVHYGRLTLGLGGEAWYSRPWLLEILSESLLGLFAGDEGHVDWRAVDWGVAPRLTAHYTGIRSVDLYGLLLAGPSSYSVDIDLELTEYAVRGSFRSAGLRLGGGAGATFVGDSGLVGGLELRYLAGWRFTRLESITLTEPDGESSEIYEVKGAQRPPRGFSWAVFLGWRF